MALEDLLAAPTQPRFVFSHTFEGLLLERPAKRSTPALHVELKALGLDFDRPLDSAGVKAVSITSPPSRREQRVDQPHAP